MFEFQFQTRESGEREGEERVFIIYSLQHRETGWMRSSPCISCCKRRVVPVSQSVSQEGAHDRCSSAAPSMCHEWMRQYAPPIHCHCRASCKWEKQRSGTILFFLLLAEADTHPAHTASARWRSVATPATGTETRKRCKAVVYDIYTVL